MTPMQNELKHFSMLFKSELLNNILPFWITHGVEKDGHGFFGAVDLNGAPVPGSRKSVVVTARILWTFSAAAVLFHKKEYAALADRAWEVISRDFADNKDGGYYRELSADNTPIDPCKDIYSHAFVLYGMCKYYELRQRPDVMEKIRELFFLLEDKAADRENRGYRESFARDWTISGKNRMADNNEPKTMNAHIHVLESYSILYRVWKDEKVRQRLVDLLELFLDSIVRPDGHLASFFDHQFNETNESRRTCSFGHDIEGSWLLWEAAEIAGDSALQNRAKKTAITMVDATDRVAVDKDGGLFLGSGRDGSHLYTNKHWWPQAETLVGFMNAYELTGDAKYWETVKRSWQFIDKCVIDHEQGEWFAKVNRLGVPFLVEPEDDPSPFYRNDRKIDPWKCPYHNGRAMMELSRRTEKMTARHGTGTP